jgi:hypothetical protein
MKRLWVVALASVLVLSGCATQASTSRRPASAFTSPTVAASSTPDPGETAAVDPNASNGAKPSDGQGATVARSAVVWSDYPAGTQADIDALTAAGDCKSLDSQHGGAAANEATVTASSGHDAEAILTYIDEARALASCS